MNKSIQNFSFHDTALRVIIDDHNNPWFVVKDVCNLLGYINSRKAVADHCRSEGVTKSYIAELSNTYQIIDEPNLYRLVMKSKLPAAEKAERWFFEEVLPCIRKTGGYGNASGVSSATENLIDSMQRELLKTSPELADALRLVNAGFSQKRSAKMLGIGETAMSKRVKTLKACGFLVKTNKALMVKGGAK